MKFSSRLFLLCFSFAAYCISCKNVNPEVNQVLEEDPGQDTPAAVIQAFKTAFPNAENPSWDEEDTLYICSFYTGDQQKDAYFNPAGLLTEVTTYIQPEELPSAVKQALNNRFPDNAPDIIVLSDKNGLKTYETDFQTGESYYSLTLTLEGKILQEIRDTLSNTEIQEMIDEEDQ